MPLEELNKDIYDPNSDLNKRKHEESQLNPSYDKQREKNPFLREESWEPEKKGLTEDQKKKIIVGASIFGAVALIIGLIVFISISRKNAFQEDRVSISIDGPKDVDSIQPAKYLLKYKNNNKVKLKNVEISLNYSANFQPSESGNVNLKQLNVDNSKIYIGEIKAGEESSVEVTGAFYAPKDSLVNLYASMRYSPANLSSEYIVKNQLGINITTAPIFLEVAAPAQVFAGDNVEYVIDYKNLDTRALTDAQIRVEFPEDFVFTSAEPLPSQGNNVWYFGVLDSQQGGKIRIQGKLKGNVGQGKAVRVKLGRVGGNEFIVYNEIEKNTQVIESALLITHEVADNPRGIVNQGNILEYIIKYGNNSDYALNDVVVRLKIKGKAVDVAKIKTGNGHFDVATGVATWKASDIPALSSLLPNTVGEIRFSVPISSKIPIENVNDKNFTIDSAVEIDSLNLLTPDGSSRQVFGNTLSVKLNSTAIFETKGYYDDFKLKNYGPLPMTVGDETSFTLHWSIANFFNDLGEAKIVSTLPSGVKWTGRIYPSGEKISYNERTNEIVWEIGTIPAGSGILQPKREVIFQVAVTPQINQVDENLKLLNSATFSGKDMFTGEAVLLENKEKTTQLQEDSSIKPEYYKVSGM